VFSVSITFSVCFGLRVVLLRFLVSRMFDLSFL